MPAATPVLPTASVAPPSLSLRDGDLGLRFAATRADIDAVQNLRFNVFNLELGEGLGESYLSGRDRDMFDDISHHLMLIDERSGECVGTYRLLTRETLGNAPFYSQGEFDFAGMPRDVCANAVELGRACISKSHRTPQAIFLLWRGIARYMLAQNKRYLFGCCSLTSQSFADAWRVFRQLERENALHPSILLNALPGHTCDPDAAAASEARIPKLFRAYLRMGALCCSRPAIDRAFGTIDYCVLFDRENMPGDAAMFFAPPTS